MSAALLVGATCLAPTPYLPWATPAHLDPATDNLIITQDVSRWNRTLTTESRVMSPNAEETAACVAVPPLKALTHTVGIPEGSSTWTGSAYLRAGEAGVRSVGFRVGPPGGGGGEVTTELDETWRRYAVTVTAESRQTTMTMALFNRHAERPAVVCVWGPQLEAGSEATDRRTLVSRLESDAPGVSSRWWGAAVLLAGLYLAFFILTSLRAVPGPSRRAITSAVTFGLLVHLAIVWLQRSSGTLRPEGLAGHPNILAAQAVVSVGLLVAALTSRSPGGLPRRVALPSAGIVAGFVMLILTGSRTGALALGLGAVGWLLVQKLKVRGATVVGLLLVALLTGVLQIRSGVDEAGWDSSRLTIYEASLRAWLASPVVGWGPGSAAARIVVESNGAMSAVPTHAHSLVLQVAVEYGLIGLTAIGLLLVGPLQWLRSRRRWWPYVLSLIPLIAFDLTLTNPNVYPALMWAFWLASSESEFKTLGAPTVRESEK